MCQGDTLGRRCHQRLRRNSLNAGRPDQVTLFLIDAIKHETPQQIAVVVRHGKLAGIFSTVDACHLLAEFLRDRFPEGPEAA